MSSRAVMSEVVRDGRLLNGQQTRQRVLHAAIVCVVRDGYAAASTVRIAEAAGVSRGALMHHFQSREALVAAAVEHLAQRRGAELARRGQDLPTGPGRVAAALDLLWDSFSGDLFKATVELWTAARTDPGLRARVDEAERRIGRGQIELFGELLGPDNTRRPDFEERVQFAVGAMRGLAVLDSFHIDPQARARQWDFHRSQLVEMFTSNTDGADR
ncbi:TetR/AcrR family transcriptional regulator [Mycolicibacterium moriokaense]|nr:TetR/AcrR family transcriptional regulator [Mycolicibacterium moriokaense]